MTDQAAFTFMHGLSTQHRRPHQILDRIYFALKPPEEIQSEISRRIASVVSSLDFAVNLTPPDRHHISLVGTGAHNGFRQAFADRLCTCAATVVASPVPICFDRVGRFNGDAIVFYSDTDLPAAQSLYRAIKDAARHEPLVGLHGPRKIEPHMTIFYTQAPFAGAIIEPIRWLATEFVLVHSHDSHHKILGRWPLTGEPYKSVDQAADLFRKTSGS